MLKVDDFRVDDYLVGRNALKVKSFLIELEKLQQTYGLYIGYDSKSIFDDDNLDPYIYIKDAKDNFLVGTNDY